MMWPLLSAALLMLVLSAIIFFWPRKNKAAVLQTPTQLFEERLQLLALARDSGELAEQDFDSAANELKSQFLMQKQQLEQNEPVKNTWRFQALLVLFTLVVVAAVYVPTGHYKQLQQWQHAKDSLPSYGERALLNKGEPLSAEEVELFALALRTRLADEGDDAVAWMLLGRIRMSQGVLEQAEDAFENALRLTPNRVPLLLSYAQTLILLGDEDSLARAGRAVARVLTQDDMNTDALSLMALIAYEKGDKEQAITAWQLLLKQLPEDDPRYDAVVQRLSELNADVAPVGRRIIVNLYVAPELKAANPDASLFLFAKAVEGSGLPLAVLRIPLPEGQQRFDLTEQMAMQPGWSLADADNVQVVARMSLSGTVSQLEGDVQIESDILSFETPSVSISLKLEP